MFVCFGEKFLMGVSVCTYQFHYEVCLFVVSLVSSAVTVLSWGVRSCLFYYFYDFKRWVKEKLATFYVKVCSAFSLKSLILSVLLFRSLIYLEFIFMYAVRQCSNFILMIISQKTCRLFFIVATTNSPEGSLFSTLSPAFIFCQLWDNGPCESREEIPHSSFDLHVSNIQ